AIANGPQTPEAQLIFDDGTPAATLAPTPVDDGLQYTYRADHVDRSMRYRLTVGDTESPWYSVTIVRQIKLKSLNLAITPPTYIGKMPSSIDLKPDAIDATPVTVPQGSSIQLTAAVDVPANGAMLQLGNQQPIQMAANTEKTGFVGNFVV